MVWVMKYLNNIRNEYDQKYNSTEDIENFIFHCFFGEF